jgi:hypothetical protein
MAHNTLWRIDKHGLLNDAPLTSRRVRHAVDDALSDAAELDMGGLSSAYRACVESSCPDALPLAVRLWQRLDPTHWMLEWHLPVWLGDAVGLERGVSSELVLSNVLGLASIRLQDDLADDEVDAADLPAARALSAALYNAALDVYRHRFSSSSPFWPRLETWMREWRSADQRAIPAPTDLARRGAPLKISAFAVCLLAGRRALFGTVDACLDHALAAMVMYDHVCDWQEDLAAGRWNAFVARYGSHLQQPVNAAANRSSVLAAMMARRAVADQFALIGVELERAARSAAELGSEPLMAYLDSLAVKLGQEANLREQRYAGLGDAALALVFGNELAPIGGAQTDGRQTARPALG